MLVLIRKHLKDNRDFGDVLILFCNLRKSVYLSNIKVAKYRYLS